jgi:uncharacterized protein YqhQ
MVISIVFFAFIQTDTRWLKVVMRIVLIPVIAGVSYEFIRLAGRSDNSVVRLISRPGLWLQKLTTREPDEEMIKVGIRSVEEVFDWKAFIEEHNRNPSKYFDGEKLMVHFLKRNRKLLNAGELKEPRLTMFKELMELS